MKNLYITFSSELPFEVDERYSKKYSEEEIENLPYFSLKFAEKAYKLSGNIDIPVDNVKGMGAMPDNQSVLYKGFVGLISIDTLLSIMPNSSEREEDSSKIIKMIEHGYSIGNPTLYLSIDPYIEAQEDGVSVKGVAKFVGHEGRARTLALKKLGVSKVPVHVIFIGYRARHVEDKESFKHWLNSGIKLERSSKVISYIFSSILFDN